VFISDCITTFASKLSQAKRCKILAAPYQSRYGRNDIVLERSLGQKFGNQITTQFLEGGRIFAWKDGSCGVAPVFEGGMNFLDLSRHWTRLRQMRKMGVIRSSRIPANVRQLT
jgi:hypothetical protein